MTQRLKGFYYEHIVPKLYQEGRYRNIHQVPRLVKIVINCGLGQAADNAKILESTFHDLALIAGQKPVVTRARQSIAGFQIRAKMPVGIFLTLRGESMYAFFDRLIHLALPRIRDFQGLSLQSFDGQGNFHLGLKEQLVFPEIEYAIMDTLRGMDISIITSASTDREALHLLESFGLPLQRWKPVRRQTQDRFGADPTSLLQGDSNI